MDWLARSADPRKKQPAQTYARHVLGVRAYVRRFVQVLAGRIGSTLLEALNEIVTSAAGKHDLGKLDSDNQSVLRGDKKAKTLPINHTDAGVVDLIKGDLFESALLVASHHIGLPDFAKLENVDETDLLREEDPARRMKEPLDVLLKRHATALGECTSVQSKCPIDIPAGDRAVFYRLALSILVDADHSDSACPDRSLEDISLESPVSLLPDKRLSALNAYVSAFKADSERNELRRVVYEECKTSVTGDRIVACDSPVGSGKTTAVMAHLLAVAKARNLRRVFVVLPFTNIIRQSVEVYRKALVLPGERAEDVIAEVHHLVDFDDEASREYATQWNAPIIVTTAVAFFETLASARPSALRRLHELVASAVFVDEAHASVPARFLPIVWRWMRSFAEDWNVHWVLASGSLVRFWEMSEVTEAAGCSSSWPVPQLIAKDVRKRSSCYERARVSFGSVMEPLSLKDLVEMVAKTSGPRLVILNTVQNAAVVARDFLKSGRFSAVFHISTALTPADRERTLETVKSRLDCDKDGDWVLVGTSCVEAGMDLDFASGFREMSSLSSLLQSSGRVNRSGSRCDSMIVSFSLKEECGINRNKGMADSVCVLRKILYEGCPIDANLCTEALRQELRLNPCAESLLSKICISESNLNFQKVEHLFRMISDDTKTVVIDADLVERIESFQPVEWREIQRNSVQLWGYRIDNLHVPEMSRHARIFKWHLKYSKFLGCMEGILEQKDFMREGGGVL